MPFCKNCGKEIENNARFCSECGLSVINSQTNNFQRKAVYKGEIHKCPNCGEVLRSMTAICSTCGHEINSAKLPPALKEFIAELNECDKIIENTLRKDFPKKGWKSWKKSTLILWFFLNIFTSFIPFVVYLTLPFFRPLIKQNTIPELSLIERRKVTIIENFTFPNDRESILEALLFTKFKIAFLVSKKADEKNIFWFRLWKEKAIQLYHKATILLNNDSIAETIYSDIVISEATVNRKLRIRAGIGVMIIIVFCVFVLTNGSFFKGVSNLLYKNNFLFSNKSVKNFEWIKTGLSTELPEIKGTSGYIWKNSDEELNIDIEGISYSQFDSYIVLCKDKGFKVDAIRETNEYIAYNSAGYKLELKYWTTEKLDIILKAPLNGDKNFKWPSHSFADLIPKKEGETGKVETSSEEMLKFTLFDILNSEFKSYVYECEDAGFTIDSEKKKNSFKAFNSKGYELLIYYNDMNAMNITIKAPIQIVEINWPSSGLAKLIPKPSVSFGKINSDYDWAFSVYLCDMTIDDFNEYIEKCIDKGFDKKYRSEHYFSAKKGDDISLNVEYVGYNIIEISIYYWNKY